MFQYEYERRPPSANSCDSRATMTTDWSRGYPESQAGPRIVQPSISSARRPLPPRPIVCERIPAKPTVPLKVWIIASASCFAVCAALVLATVAITKWGATQTYTRELFETPEPVYPKPQPIYEPTTTAITEVKPFTEETKSLTTKNTKPSTTEENKSPKEETQPTEANDIQLPVLETLPIFKNTIASRNSKVNLASKPQIHPLHDHIYHEERRIEKKDHAKLPYHDKEGIPEFKPTLPDIFNNKHKDNKLFDGYIAGLRKYDSDYEEYYNDDNLYDDYIHSNSMTNYLIEKVQELHNWITSDPDFEQTKNTSKKFDVSNQFGQLLKALNESIIEGNATIVMNKLRDLYFGDNYTSSNHSRKIILTNTTDLLSFGILSLDVMLLHNIQLMAWENQEAARIKMLKDPDVFAFNALFLDPTKVEAKQNEINHYEGLMLTKRQNLRQDLDDFDVGKSILENFLEIGMSTARAAIHLGRAYKNTKNIINHQSHREPLTPNSQTQHSRNIGNTYVLNHLQASFNGVSNGYTELDCVWLLYCRNLVATSKLNPPFGTMARINGLALRMLTGELPADRALDTMLFEAFSGWTELKCDEMFPRCSQVNAASVVLDAILQPLRKSQSANRMR